MGKYAVNFEEIKSGIRNATIGAALLLTAYGCASVQPDYKTALKAEKAKFEDVAKQSKAVEDGKIELYKSLLKLKNNKETVTDDEENKAIDANLSELENLFTELEKTSPQDEKQKSDYMGRLSAFKTRYQTLLQASNLVEETKTAVIRALYELDAAKKADEEGRINLGPTREQRKKANMAKLEEAEETISNAAKKAGLVPEKKKEEPKPEEPKAVQPVPRVDSKPEPKKEEPKPKVEPVKKEEKKPAEKKEANKTEGSE